MYGFTEIEDDFVLITKIDYDEMFNKKLYIDIKYFENSVINNSSNISKSLDYDIKRGNYSIDNNKINNAFEFYQTLNNLYMNSDYFARMCTQSVFSLPCKMLLKKMDNDTYLGETNSPMYIEIFYKTNSINYRKCLSIFKVDNGNYVLLNKVYIYINYVINERVEIVFHLNS